MVKKEFSLIGILAIILMFLTVIIGCDNESTNDNGFDGDTALNGKWVDNRPATLKFDNGIYEYYFNNLPYDKGTYTTNNGQITITVTHIGGKQIENNINVLDLGNLVDLTEFELELNKWYSMNELKAMAGNEIFNLYASMAGMDPVTYKLSPYTYSISGNVLTFAQAQYTKQQ